MARNDRERFNREPKDDIIKKTIDLRRVTKVVKGGRTMRFSALVVCGDGKGRVGIGMGKAAEVPEAIEKANKAAVKNMFSISTSGRTIPHTVIGEFGSLIFVSFFVVMMLHFFTSITTILKINVL